MAHAGPVGYAAARGGNAVGRYATSGWETGDFPLVCAPCLGPTQYLRMMKAPFDEECKMCNRPFTVFRWRPQTKKGKSGSGRGAVGGREVRTAICQQCARHQNTCQACLRDFRFGLDHAQREAVEKATGNETRPVSAPNQEWYAQQAEIDIARGHSAGAQTSLTVQSLAAATQKKSDGAKGGGPQRTGLDLAASRAERMRQAALPYSERRKVVEKEDDGDDYFQLPKVPVVRLAELRSAGRGTSLPKYALERLR